MVGVGDMEGKRGSSRSTRSIRQMTASSLHHRTVAENHLVDLQNPYGGRAGYARAMLYLQVDAEKSPEVASLRQRWASPFEFLLGKSQVRVSIVDCERFINLSQLTNEKGEVNPVVAAQLRRLVKLLRFTPDIADRTPTPKGSSRPGRRTTSSTTWRSCSALTA